MNKLIKTIAVLTALAALAAFAVSCGQAFEGTDIPAETLTALTEGANAIPFATLAVSSYTATIDISDDVGDLTDDAAEQLTVAFSNGKIDESCLDDAIAVYNLLGPAAPDGGRPRDNELDYSKRVLLYNPVLNASYVVFTFDMTDEADFSSIIEVFIDPEELTANGGTKRLDVDDDAVQGEDQDDDYIGYVGLTGGGKADPAGAAKNPRLPFSWTGEGALGIDDDDYIMTYAGPAFDTTNYDAIAEDAFTLQRFEDGAWADVNTTGTYNTGTHEFTMTLPATDARQAYRVRTNYSAAFRSAVTINGYRLKGTTDQTDTADYSSVFYTADTPVTYNTAIDAAYVYVRDSNFRNAYVDLALSGLSGSQGFGGFNAENVRLYYKETSAYLPVIDTIKINTYEYRFIIDPAFLLIGTAADFLDVHVSPSVIDRGSIEATTDDLSCGDYTNVTQLPFGWKIIDGTNNTP